MTRYHRRRQHATRGHAEVIIGDFFARTPGRRDRVVLATKFLSNLSPGDPNGGGAGRQAMVAAGEQSLRRLKTASIDLYWMHCWDQHTPIDETMRGPRKVAQAQTEARFRGWAPLIALQIEYSLIERTVEGELMPMAQELGLGVTPWSPLRGGLSGKYTRENAATKKSDRGRNPFSIFRPAG
ncbi:MAG: aldo/keto reductase [Acidobacteria bacterium]|nr:aldo/keto reductase [Acidobacteriota bacterium]